MPEAAPVSAVLLGIAALSLLSVIHKMLCKTFA
jgi:hypothetical protein